MKTSRCKHPKCNAIIVWLKTVKGKNMPVDMESLTEDDITDLDLGESEHPLYRHGEHTSHFETCVAAQEFKDRRRDQW